MRALYFWGGGSEHHRDTLFIPTNEESRIPQKGEYYLSHGLAWLANGNEFIKRVICRPASDVEIITWKEGW